MSSPDQYSFSNELGSAGEKVARKWLSSRFKNMRICKFQEIGFKNTRALFEEKYEDFIKYCEETKKLVGDGRSGSIDPDFLIISDNVIHFIEVKVNEANPTRNQKNAFQIAKDLGFNVQILRLNVRIDARAQLVDITDSQLVRDQKLEIDNDLGIDFNDEYDAIARKVLKAWLQKSEFTFYDFIDILWKIALLKTTKVEENRKILRDIFSDKYDNMINYKAATLKLAKKAALHSHGEYYSLGIGPQFIVKNGTSFTFYNALTTQSKIKKYTIHSLEIAKEYGFQTQFHLVDSQIQTSKDISLTDF